MLQSAWAPCRFRRVQASVGYYKRRFYPRLVLSAPRLPEERAHFCKHGAEFAQVPPDRGFSVLFVLLGSFLWLLCLLGAGSRELCMCSSRVPGRFRRACCQEHVHLAVFGLAVASFSARLWAQCPARLEVGRRVGSTQFTASCPEWPDLARILHGFLWFGLAFLAVLALAFRSCQVFRKLSGGFLLGLAWQTDALLRGRCPIFPVIVLIPVFGADSL